MRSLVRTLNPWRKEEGKVEQIQPLPQDSSVEDANRDLLALGWQYMPAALALLKVRQAHNDCLAIDI